MRLLFDHNVPVPLRRLLPAHDIVVAGERGWGRLTNGELLSAAEQAGFDVFVTADKNLVYQQNLTKRTITILVLSTQRLAVLQTGIAAIERAIRETAQGAYLELDLPRPTLLRRAPPDRDT